MGWILLIGLLFLLAAGGGGRGGAPRRRGAPSRGRETVYVDERPDWELPMDDHHHHHHHGWEPPFSVCDDDR